MIKAIIERIVAKVASLAIASTYANSELSKLYMAQGEIASRLVRGQPALETLADAEFSVFSQWGEDGIIEWLVNKLGSVPECFVEFGVENYRESNTRFLLQNRNWRGLIIDGSTSNIDVVHGDVISWRHDLTAIASFITRENIDKTIREAGMTGEIGLLSVDIDGNDYWVWDAINCIAPVIVIMEYNSAFGDVRALTVPYDPAFRRGAAHASNLYYGASIAALILLGARKGYTMIGTNRAGSNAFFIRNDYANAVLSAVRDTRPRPSRFREARGTHGDLLFERGRSRSDIIGDCLVTDVTEGVTMPLREFGELYTSRWSALLDGRIEEPRRA